MTLGFLTRPRGAASLFGCVFADVGYKYRESFVQQYFAKMVAKVAELNSQGEAASSLDGGSSQAAASLLPPPPYQEFQRGGGPPARF